jgi:tetratricopeptide (TPR) repeat protein
MNEFDIAISFAGEDRDIAKEFAVKLTKSGLRIFYDDYEQANLLGETLTEYLIDIYKNKASFCLVLVSKHYIVKRWTRHEWKAAQARAFEEYDKAYILPIRIDDSELPGLLPTIGYMTLKKDNLSDIVNVILQKTLFQSEFNNVLRIATNSFKNGEYQKVLEYLLDAKYPKELEGSVEGLKLLAETYLIIEEPEKSLEIFQKIRIKQPDNADNWFIIGVCLFRLGRYNEAIGYYEKALELNPRHFTANLDLNVLKRLSWLTRIPLFKKLFLAYQPERRLKKKLNNLRKKTDEEINY